MSSHQPLPTICEACHQAIQDEVEAEPRLRWTFRWCPETRALAIVDADEGEITGWAVEGPMSQDLAIASIKEGISDAETRAYVDQLKDASAH